MKIIIKNLILLILPKNFYALIMRARFMILNPTLWNASNSYKSTDEDEKFKHLLEAINYIKIAGANNVLPHVFFEFGCHSARTFSAAVNAANYLNTQFKFYAFDSFQGLPITENENTGIFQEGTFNTSKHEFKKILKKKTGYSIPDQNIIEGYYDSSLNESAHNQVPDTVGIVHIDVDLYSSTVLVLDFVKDKLVDGGVILFDDYYCFPFSSSRDGERKALYEFENNNPAFKFVKWKSYSSFGQSFFVVKQTRES